MDTQRVRIFVAAANEWATQAMKANMALDALVSVMGRRHLLLNGRSPVLRALERHG